MRDFFDSVLDFFFAILDFFHTIFEPVFGAHSWGWSIIALTLLVRVLLLPLAIKQTRSMRAMQAIQPQVKELQKKYKVDRELMRKDPETYRARRQKLSEEQMALFKREGANPAASCLPLLAQAPIFIALFWMLQGQSDPGDPLFDAPFYFFTRFIDAPAANDPSGLAATVSAAGWPGWLLIVLMSGSMFITQRQMLARNAAMGTDNPMAQQQKILMYVMPVFLAFISFRFPLGILLYWVTTNIWQIAQQWIILREVQHEVDSGEIADKPGGSAAARTKKKGDGGDGAGRRSPGASSGRKKLEPDADDTAGDGSSQDRPKTKGGKGKGRGKAAAKGSDDAGDGGARARDDGGSARAPGSGSAGGDRSGSNGSKGSSGATPPGADAAGTEQDGDDGGDRAGGNGDGDATRARPRDHLPRRRGGSSS